MGKKRYFYILFTIISLTPLFSYYFYKEFFLAWFSFAIIGSFCLVKRTLDKLSSSKKSSRKSNSLGMGDDVFQAQEEIIKLNRRIDEMKILHKKEMEKKISEMKEAYLEFEDIKKEKERISSFCTEIKKEAEEKLKQKETIESEYQLTIAEQRAILEKNKIYISRLESKIQDLNFEIRSLFQLEKTRAPDNTLPRFDTEETLSYISAKTSSTYDLSFVLKKYIYIAESFKGAETLGKQGGRRLLRLGYDNLSLDLRHLFESFRDETSKIVFIYSFQENKMLFANNFVKTALGYSPDKFVKEFPSIIKEGLNEWDLALKRITSGNEEKFKLLLNTKTKKEILFQGLIKGIKHGPFVNHAIGILKSP